MKNDAARILTPGSINYRMFVRTIKTYYRREGRVLSWRPPALALHASGEVVRPYEVLVSEVMLQQTQVGRVKEKYEEFIKRFPDVRALAQAPLSDVLRLWQGLGYNRRALFLKRAAEEVVAVHGGILPCSREVLETLPGIGGATAASIAVFAWNIPEIFVETNIRSVFIHFFFPDAEKISDAELLPLIEKTLDRKNPRERYYALMDYGTMLKKQHKNPSRRSAAHIRQKRFKGSLREARGAVIRAVLEHSYSLAELKKLLRLEPHKIGKAVLGLMKEGFLKKTNGKYGMGE